MSTMNELPSYIVNQNSVHDFQHGLTEVARKFRFRFRYLVPCGTLVEKCG
jgi:hypothetical protein